MTGLNAKTVSGFSPAVGIPHYDRSVITGGIVHFGVGAFHRSHEAMFIHRILESGITDWGIVGVGTLAGDSAMRDALVAQDCLYTLVTTSPNGEVVPTVIGSIIEYIFAPDDAAAVLARIDASTTRIVSLTITEGGYGVNDATGEFDPSDAATLADLVGFASGAVPRSPLGFITAGLAARRAAGRAPFTVMSCDNIQGNGEMAGKAIIAFATLVDPELAQWIVANVRFPNSMVDRITPATTDEVRTSVSERFGVEDRWPVLSESFEQWVLEDNFSDGRPPFELVGVQLVDDVSPYEKMKLRLLNASHQAMSYLGLLSGASYVHEVCRDEPFSTFLREYMSHEAIPTLEPVPGILFDEYCAELMGRFKSEAIKDTLARQVVDGSARIPKFLLPVISDRLAAGESIRRSALVLAAWSRFIDGTSDSGVQFELVDRRITDLRAAVNAEEITPGAFLDYAAVFGELGTHPVLRAEFVAARSRLAAVGARLAMAEVNSKG
jgi:mannitol 2-dehydrogenase